MSAIPFRRCSLHQAVVLSVLCMPVHAQTHFASDEMLPTGDLPGVSVTARKVSTQTYRRDTIDNTPTGNRDLTSLVANHPAVRLNPSVEQAGNRGSLAPETLSIHGASPYQNQFLIDGISGTNIISPQSNNLNLQIGNVPGFAQAYNIDTELVDQVAVYDSLIPIEFGKFTGGVIDARVKTPTGSNTFTLKRSLNSSKLTQQRIAKSEYEDWAAGEPGTSSTWRKHFSSAHADLRLTERNNLLLAVSRRESDITRQFKAIDSGGGTVISGQNAYLTDKTATDRVDNALLKVHTTWNTATESSVLVKLADRQENLVSNTYADTAWTNQQQAQGIATELQHTLTQGGQIKINLGYDQLDNLRHSDSDEFVTYQFYKGSSMAYPSYTTGGFGTESLKQHQRTAKLRYDLPGFQTASIQHQMYVGLEGQNMLAKFIRDQDVLSYTSRLNLSTGTVSERSKNLYKAGTVGAQVHTTSAYLSDTMRWRAIDATVSARMDQDDLFDNTNVSPRARLGWDVFGNGQTQLQSGWSRYYGMDLLGYALEAGKSQLKVNLLNSTGGNGTGAAAGETHRFEGIRTPHTDETALNLTQRLGVWLQGKVAYVQRAYRDDVIRTGSNSTGYTYTNDGQGNNQTITFTLQTSQPVAAWGARWHGQLNFSWQHSQRNTDVGSAWEADLYQPDDIVEYNGVPIEYQHLPSREFNQPRRITFDWSGEWKPAGITWGHRVNWNSSRDAVVYIGSSKGIDRYASRNLGAYWTWDTAATYKPAALKGMSFTVDVLNLLNQIKPTAILSPTSAANQNAYSTGREIWLTVGYTY
ncbi:MAG: TonB-dependent receptor plug domain-containing protein [Aquabacterium sp.]|uniref:TonB-dependent receptor plug domain-containing protein n=1 Tax=Aquabacterium sp. TaxID=1872578 RepID=UPI003BCAC6C2